MIDINEIMKVLPHRYPFLLVDRVLEMEENRIRAIKNVTFNEPFFVGHFPDRPVMPGVLIVEALAQVGAVLVLQKPEFAGKLVLFAGIDKLRFRRQVVPGDVLRLELEVISFHGPVGKAKALATVDGVKACEGEITFAVQK